MKNTSLQPVSELISWIALGVTFPISALMFQGLRRGFAEFFEDALPGKPLPVLTEFFIALPPIVPLFATGAGVLVALAGIFLRRKEGFQSFQVFLISIGWITVFLFMGSFIMAFFLPFVRIMTHAGLAH